MNTIARRTAFACTCLFATSQSFAAGYFLESRPTTPDIYTYFGASWQDPNDSRSHIDRQQLEGRLITSKDSELAIRTQIVREEVPGADHSDVGDTFISIGQGFRPEKFLEFWSIEVGAALKTAPDELSDDIDSYSRVRFLGGPTRLGLEFSATVFDHSLRQPGVSETSVISAIGTRSQFTIWHLGVDFEYSTRSGFKDGQAVNLVAMRRGLQGRAFYGIVNKGIGGSQDGLFIGAGFEFRFSSP